MADVDEQALLLNSYKKDFHKTQKKSHTDLKTYQTGPQFTDVRISYGLFKSIKLPEVFILLIGVCFSLVQGVVPLAFYYFFGQLIGHADSEDLPHDIRRTAYLFLGVAAVAGISQWGSSFFLGCAGERIANRIRHETFRALSRQDVAFFDTQETGILLQRLGEDCQTIREAFSLKFGQAFTASCQFCVGLGAAFYYSWKMTLVMLGVAPVLSIVIGLQAYFTKYYTTQGSNLSGKCTSIAQEVITGFRTVKSFDAEEHECEKYNSVLKQVLNLAYRKSFTVGLTQGLVFGSIWATCAVAFLFGGYLVDKDELTLGDLVTVFGMTLFGVMGLGLMSTVLSEMFNARASFALVKTIILRQPDINFGGGKVIEKKNVKGTVSFENVTFRYPSRDIDVLKNMNLNVNQGERIALVGESGSGKSTVFGLIERFYDPYKGKILIDNIDIRELNPQWLHLQIAMVSQEPILFTGSITENIKYGKSDASFEEVVEAAKLANAHSFIIGLPDKYETKIGERGFDLSGGQKQRVAIARAVLKDPKILLLDEATSALDAESERLVQDALDNLMVGRTTLIIAHRLSTVKNADLIYVMDKGVLVENGTHDELLEANGKYKQLAQRQLVHEEQHHNSDEGTSG